LTLRDDWWDKDNPANQGLFNIQRIRYDVVKDPGLTFEKLKKGEIEYWAIPKAQWWAEALPKVEAFKRGLLVGQKHYNEAPTGTSGLAINMRRAPLDDRLIRRALQHLSDRKTMIKKLFYNEYEPLTSYHQGSPAHNPKNALLEYDELSAVELLEEAGWTEKNSEGYRVKDGRELKLNLQYRSALSERSLTIFQESCKRAGIRIDLQLLTPASAWKNLMNREFDLASTAWTGLTFPNPETSYHSKLADQSNNNNITGFANPRVDALCAEYDAEYEVAKRNDILREIDGIVYETSPYVLEWFNPAQRVVYWNKLEMPEWGSMANGRNSQLFYIWWIDPVKEEALKNAKKDATLTLETPPVKVRFWEAWRAANTTSATPTQPEQTNE
jgi:microcin C transport system substrate-binding protein